MRKFMPAIAGLATVLFISIFFGLFGVHGWGITAAATGAGILVYTALQNKAASRLIPIANESLRKSLLTQPGPETARIVVYRANTFLKEGFMGATLGIDIAVDGRIITQLTNPRMTAFDVAPGTHRLTAGSGAKVNHLDVTLAHGELAIYQTTLPKGSMGGVFGLIREEDNVATLQKLSAVPLVAPDSANNP